MPIIIVADEAISQDPDRNDRLDREFTQKQSVIYNMLRKVQSLEVRTPAAVSLEIEMKQSLQLLQKSLEFTKRSISEANDLKDLKFNPFGSFS